MALTFMDYLLYQLAGGEQFGGPETQGWGNATPYQNPWDSHGVPSDPRLYNYDTTDPRESPGAYQRNPAPSMPSRNALLPFIPGMTGLGALWQQMQQGSPGPFGDQAPPPYGPYGPGRPFMVPDENMRR